MQEIDDVEDGELSDEASNEYVRSSTLIFYWFQKILQFACLSFFFKAWKYLDCD